MQGAGLRDHVTVGGIRGYIGACGVGLGFRFLKVIGPFWGPKALGFYSSLVLDESCFVVL